MYKLYVLVFIMLLYFGSAFDAEACARFLTGPGGGSTRTKLTSPKTNNKGYTQARIQDFLQGGGSTTAVYSGRV